MLIEINLAPGSSRRSGGRKKAAPKFLSAGAFGGDRRTALLVAGGALLLIFLLFGYGRMGSRIAALETEVAQAVEDSTRYAATIELMRSLEARQDTIRQKISVIRSVDTRRYVWPHLLDQISLAVPPYTWLTSLTSTDAGDGGPTFTLQGNAGSTPALTRFMTNLEASPFIRDVTLVTAEQQVVDGRTIQRFSLEARYRDPGPELIETVSILAVEE